MTEVKIKFRASSIKTKEGTLYFQITHNQFVRQIKTEYKLFSHEWNRHDSSILIPKINKEKRYYYLIRLKKYIKSDIKRILEIISQINSSNKKITYDQIVRKYKGTTLNPSFIYFVRSQIIYFAKIGKYSASEKLESTLNSFICFYGKDNISFKSLNKDLIEEYEYFLKEKGLCMNTISFYMRNLRSVYNMAVEKGLITQQNPFKNVYTGIDKTIKRAISIEIIRKIKNLDLKKHPSKELARDIFMFSFYTRGMSFIDMAFLKKTDLCNGVLIYRRHKTNQQLTIKWEKPMQEIVSKYKTKNTPYLLPIINKNDIEERIQYKNAVHLVNNKLKSIGKDIGINIPLTTYVARHSWASIAQKQNIPISIISKALGHDSEKTTQIYLDTLDTSTIDKANIQIIESI